MSMHEMKSDVDRQQSQAPKQPVSVPNGQAGLEHHNAMGGMEPRSAEEVFFSYSEPLGWDCLMQAEVLARWFSDEVVWPLLQCIQQEGQTEHFAQFLVDNFGEDLKRSGGGVAAPAPVSESACEHRGCDDAQ